MYMYIYSLLGVKLYICIYIYIYIYSLLGVKLLFDTKI